MENLKPTPPWILNVSDSKLKTLKDIGKIETIVKELNLSMNLIE